MNNAKSEVLRYLGYNGQQIAPGLDSMITECMIQMADAVSPRTAKGTFVIKPVPDGVLLENTGILLRGNDIRGRLDGCFQAVVMAATLGVQADNLIRRYEGSDLTRSLVFDACATQLIEQYCDDIEENVCRESVRDGFVAVRRFSPGYGDLPLDVQPELLALVDAGRKIGLTCTDSLIMLPRKSVTAIIGLAGTGNSTQPERKSCDNCTSNSDCKFKRRK